MAAEEKFMDAVVSYSDAAGLDFERWRGQYAMEGSMLNSWSLGGNASSSSSSSPPSLPEQVHLLTAEEWHGNSRDSVLLRFEHQFAAGEDDRLSAPAEFDLDSLFAGYSVAKMEEVTLVSY